MMNRALCLAVLIIQAIDLTSCNGKQQLAHEAATSAARAVQAVGKSVQALKEIASIGWLYGHSAPAELAESTAGSVAKILAAAASKPADPSVTAEQTAGLAFVKSRTAVQQAGLAAEAAVKANEHMRNIASVWAVEAKNALREAAAAAKQTERALKRLIPQGSGPGSAQAAHHAPQPALRLSPHQAHQAPHHQRQQVNQRAHQQVHQPALRLTPHQAPHSSHAPQPAPPQAHQQAPQQAAKPLVPGATLVGGSRKAFAPAPDTNSATGQSLSGFFAAMRKQVKQQLQPQNNQGNNFQALQTLLSQLALLNNHQNGNNSGFFTE